MKKYIRLSEYAKCKSINYKTAWNHWKSGKLKGSFKDEFGNILVESDIYENGSQNRIQPLKAAIYARVSNADRKESLESQNNILSEFCISNGYVITHSIKEIASGMNDSRPKLLKLFDQKDWDVLVVENKDRLTRFGFNYIQKLLETQNKKIQVVNVQIDDHQDLIADLTSIIYSFTARIYGKRRAKRKEQISEFIQSGIDQ